MQTAQKSIVLFNLQFKNIKMVWKHVAQDTKFVNKLVILSHICHIKLCYLKIVANRIIYSPQMWRAKKYCWTSLLYVEVTQMYKDQSPCRLQRTCTRS